MRSIKVQQGQSLFDIAILYLGSALGAILIAGENDLSITDSLTPGQELWIPTEIISRVTVKDLRKNGINIATGVSISDEMAVHYAVATYAGYNYWE